MARVVRLLLCGILLVLAACAPQPGPAPTSIPTPAPASPSVPAPTSLPSPEPTVSPGTLSAAQPQPARVEEIAFQSGLFHLVGDLRLPAGDGPFPAVVFVHGSGPTDRTASGTYLPIMERMARAGYATFSWDKPGSGESTGQLSSRKVHSQRARIVLEAVEILKAHPAIDRKRIGLWGASQAGYVIPRVLMQSDDIAFVICVSCPAISSDDQYAYQVTALALCEMPQDKAGQQALLLAELDKARAHTTYPQYLEYRRALEALAELASVSLANWPALSAANWQKNDSNLEAYWNPIVVVEQTRIPVLAIFGEQDRQIDPLQGVTGYRRALDLAGNPKSRVELYPSANHGIMVSETGCPDRDSRWLEQFLTTLGYESQDQAQAAIGEDPRLLDAFAPGYLGAQEEWLTELYLDASFP